jgi:aminoglycoside phosphotransferase (APT) family kinase protein
MTGSGAYQSPRALPLDPHVLERFLAMHIPGLHGALRIADVEHGGQSNPTYFLNYDNRRLVLRKKPAGQILPSAHAIDREYRVMSALANSPVPVPRLVLYHDSDEVIGTPYYIMERMEGRVFADCALPGTRLEERAAIYRAAAETLAHIHRIDFAAVGLNNFGKHGGYYARQVARWTQQRALSKTQDDGNFDFVAEWLASHIPDDEATTLVHGDYRIGNLMFKPDLPEVAAVFDWELSTLGDPLADLAHACVYSWFVRSDEFGGLADRDLAALRLPTLTQFVAAYFAASGRPNRLGRFHLAFALFRNAAIFEGIAARARAGNAAGANAERVGRLAPLLAARAVAVIQNYPDELQE